MANKKAVYSVSVACLGFVCFAVGATAVGLPMWGYFQNPDNIGHDTGYFGPWRMCKKLLYNREKCGVEVARFRPSVAVYIAGVVAAVGVSLLGLFCIFSVIQMAMVASKDKVVLRYTHLVMLKMALALLASLLAIAAAGLFAIQIDEKDTQGFVITRGEAFYIQILSIALNCILFIMSIYDTLYSRREGGDPTISQSSPDLHDTTINNPGFREAQRSGVSITDSSGKPYVYNGHGSLASMNTTATTITSLSTEGSVLARSPLRSSLKKPRPPRDESNAGMGFHNPGFSGHSPTLSRNGSQKKVRIQTHSTEV
ncbi:uncharacterized protein LOC143920087 [Arctopsyche grandis]|uniref:uncharacterized protein LOC143920087 n=1 Tax=Arctopsyche grandis TaxID=121162 RepID=UPI00406D7B92